jgi:RHS repeat-associated protein
MFRALRQLLLTLASAALLLAYSSADAAKKTVHFYNDISGSPQMAVDADRGQVLWKENYKPYGERINNAPASSTGTGKNTLYFHGKQTEPLNGGVTLSYFGARYYDPSIGRFMGVDPVHFVPPNVHSFNRFAYGNNNPYRFKDPDGNIPLDTIADIGSIVWDAGRALGAAAAYAHGAISGNQSLKAVAGEGLRDTGVDLGISVGAAFTPYVSAGMVKSGKGFVDGYRAVSKSEADDIAKHGFRAAPDGRSMQEKWFSETKEGAEKFRAKYPDLQEVVKAKVPKDVYDRSYKHPNIDNTGAGFCVQCSDLKNIPKP